MSKISSFANVTNTKFQRRKMMSKYVTNYVVVTKDDDDTDHSTIGVY